LQRPARKPVRRFQGHQHLRRPGRARPRRSAADPHASHERRMSVARSRHVLTHGILVLALALGLAVPVRPAAAAINQGKLITLDATDAYLANLLTILAEKGDLNIITVPAATRGPIALHTKRVPAG